MTVHRFIDVLNAMLAGAFLTYFLPETPLGRIAQAAAMVVVSYPVLKHLFAPQRYLLFASVMVIGVVSLEVASGGPQALAGGALTWVILAAAIIGFLVTRRRGAVGEDR